MATSTINSGRPSGLIDPRRPGDYPIILGDSLKSDSKAKDSFLNIRYNWQPKSGFPDGYESKMRISGDRWHLDVSTGGSQGYQYVARLPSEQAAASGSGTKSLALIFDASKSAFVLEAISATLDMNLRAGRGMSKEDARGLPQLPKDLQSTMQSHANDHASTSSDDETADISNPYDFRHFLAEAQENIEKAKVAPGNRTPIPGGRTPVSGTSTPIPGGNRFLPATPQFRLSPATNPIKSTEQRRKKVEAPSRTAKSTSKASSKRDTPKKNQPLSKATISDSDDSDNQTIDVARVTVSKQTTSRPTQPSASKGHTRNISTNIGSSPHIIINDDDGGLEIDMGSLPSGNFRSRRRRVDPEMFRSHTGTPIGGLSSNLGSRPVSRPPVEEPARNRRQRERDNDIKMRDIEAASEEDENDDVEEFELGSPSRESTAPRRGHVSRDDDSGNEDLQAQRPQQQQSDHVAPTPPPASTYEEDEEDLLEAALEAALEEEDDNQHGGIGLGIGMANNNVQDDDESEVSEEE